MVVNAVKSGRLGTNAPSIEEVIDQSLDRLAERTVLAVTSKIVAICEGRLVPIDDSVNKKELIAHESDYYLPSSLSKYDFSFTITHNTLIPSAGIDESNGFGNYVLWPEDPGQSANKIRAYLRQRFNLREVGVVITDSTARPLHYGTEGVAIAFSGFVPANDYRGTPDLFGRELKVSISNIADALASAAVVVMGEGSESTPFATISDVPFVQFQDSDPSPEQLKGFYVSHLEDDLFEPFLKNQPWEKGGRQ